MEFSEKLKELRSEKEISQAKLAADIHISRSAVAKWENGLGVPSDESLKLLADYFGITTDELNPNINRPIAQPAAKPMMTFFCWSMVLFFDTRISSLLLLGISSSVVMPK